MWIDSSEGIKALISKLEDKYSRRNFALGKIYLSTRLNPDSIIEGLGSPREQCTRYFTQYYRKSACFGDIQSYVANLSKEDQSAFLKEINSFSDETEVLHSVIFLTQTPLQKVYREINVLKFDYMLRQWDVNDDLSRCWRIYIDGTKFLEPSEDTDVLPGDDALLLGCYTLVKAYNTTSIRPSKSR